MAFDSINDRPEPKPGDVRPVRATVVPGERLEPAPDFIENTPLLRQMFFDRRFGVAAVVLVLLVLGGALGILRIWTDTPPHIQPGLRRSLFDKLQARSLRRTALRNQAAGDWEAALLAWRLATVNHPGDPELFRGLLTNVAIGPKIERERLAWMGSAATLLLQLSLTNVVDLGLVAAAYRNQGYEEDAVNILSQDRDRLEPAGVTILLKALFDTGRITETGILWERLPPGFNMDPELSLYRDAWVVGLGSPGEIPAAMARLRAAETNAATAVLVAHLKLELSEFRDDPDDARRSLEFLEQAQKDRFEDHIRYWRLLARTGRRDEARRLARAGNRVPNNSYAFADMVRVLVEFGLVQDAEDLLREQLAGNGALSRIPRLWAMRAKLLDQLKRWDDLRGLGLELRSNVNISAQMAGYGWFLEAVAELELGRASSADAALERMLSLGILEPGLCFEVGVRLRRLGRSDAATKILAQVAQVYGNSAEYWFQVQLAAYESRDAAAFRDAAERAHRMQPTNLTFANNFAAALLMDRSDPARAMSLTEEAWRRSPGDSRLNLNYCLALVQNNRFREAERILVKFNPAQLPALERSTYHEVAFELACQRTDAEAAKQHLQGIDRAHLFPQQIQWLDAALAKVSLAKPDRVVLPFKVEAP